MARFDGRADRHRKKPEGTSCRIRQTLLGPWPSRANVSTIPKSSFGRTTWPFSDSWPARLTAASSASSSAILRLAAAARPTPPSLCLPARRGRSGPGAPSGTRCTRVGRERRRRRPRDGLIEPDRRPSPESGLRTDGVSSSSGTAANEFNPGPRRGGQTNLAAGSSGDGAAAFGPLQCRGRSREPAGRRTPSRRLPRDVAVSSGVADPRNVPDAPHAVSGDSGSAQATVSAQR